MGRVYHLADEQRAALRAEVRTFIKGWLGVDINRDGWWHYAEHKHGPLGDDVRSAIERYIGALDRLDRVLDHLVGTYYRVKVATEQTGGPLTIEQEAWLRGAMVTPAPSAPAVRRPRQPRRAVAKGGA